jgi:predicted Zn-dependent protease with MMP-like domain
MLIWMFLGGTFEALVVKVLEKILKFFEDLVEDLVVKVLSFLLSQVVDVCQKIK